MTQITDDKVEQFLEGPLFKEASPSVPYLETYSPEWRAGAQAIGFYKAAETLIDVIIERRYPTSRTLLHPLLFLYRHALELKLKRLIAEHGIGAAAPLHELNDLWHACKQLISRYHDDDTIEKVECLVEELHAVYPNGQAFRYASTRKGKPIEIDFDSVELVHLRKQMDDLDTFFFSLNAVIDQRESVG